MMSLLRYFKKNPPPAAAKAATGAYAVGVAAIATLVEVALSEVLKSNKKSEVAVPDEKDRKNYERNSLSIDFYRYIVHITSLKLLNLTKAAAEDECYETSTLIYEKERRFEC